MKVFAVKCPQCGDIIYSRATHDFHYCSCNNVFIDGGFEYSRIGAKDLDSLTQLEIDINTTKNELYKDWSKSIDKFGIIKKDEPCTILNILKSNGQKSKNSKQTKSQMKNT